LIVIFVILDVSQIRAVEIKKICYVWCDTQGKFQKLVGLDRGLTTAQLHTYKGYSVQEQLIRYYLNRRKVFNIS
jgi:argonaute-like protein implicated in RNA metabolism and viral defense